MEKKSNLLFAFISGVIIAHDLGFNNAKEGKTLTDSRTELSKMMQKARKETSQNGKEEISEND